MIKLRIDQKILKFFKTINFSFFIIFLIISCFFWIVTKFSNTYKIKNDFYINWINIPETIVIDDQQKKISILLSASGFEILLYKFFKDNIDLSLDKDVTYNNNIAQVNINKKMYEIENQLFENNKIEDLISKQISFKYSILSRKKSVRYKHKDSTLKLAESDTKILNFESKENGQLNLRQKTSKGKSSKHYSGNKTRLVKNNLIC